MQHQRLSPPKNKSKNNKQIEEQSDIRLPLFFRYIKHECPSIVYRFLEKRRVSIKTCEKYHVGFCKYGKYAQRLIIPIYFENKLVGFQGRDVTGKSNMKYNTSETKINNYLYNYNSNINEKIIIVEGVFDAWRLGENTLCSFGTHLTSHQQKLIINKRPKQVVFAWDGNAYLKAKHQAKQLRPFIDDIKVIQLPINEDPDSLDRKKIFQLVEKTNLLK